MRDRFKIEGVLRIYEHPFRHILGPGALEAALQRNVARTVVAERNLIVDDGLEILVALLTEARGVHTINASSFDQNSFQNLAIRQMLISDDVSPPAPAIGDTALAGATDYTLDITYPAVGDNLLVAVRVATGVVRFSGLVQPQDFNGTIFTEEGLFTISGEMFAHTTFSHTKSENSAVQFDHQVSLVRA